MLGGKFYGYMWFMKRFFFYYICISEWKFIWVSKIKWFGYFVGMLILIKVNILWGLKNKEKE